MYAQQKRNCHYITNHTTQAGQFFLRFLKTQKRAVCGTQKKNTKVFTTNNNLLILNVRGAGTIKGTIHSRTSYILSPGERGEPLSRKVLIFLLKNATQKRGPVNVYKKIILPVRC
eukprot:GEMP01048271.1.p2 GENE.GEMP01048271.1~~GEMP01048271.1.p2  ORF type:complete len:115 (-),score=5.98 GEMP01048271.1:362-706(-)